MRSTPLILALAASCATLAMAGGALADTVSLVCHVHEVRARGGSHDFKRRLDIDFGAHSVRYSDDIGHGWEFKRQGPFVSADAGRIVLDAGMGKESSVDRRTGEYAFHNQRDGVTIRGSCEKTAAEKPKF
jgi:hypothetical protein